MIVDTLCERHVPKFRIMSLTAHMRSGCWFLSVSCYEQVKLCEKNSKRKHINCIKSSRVSSHVKDGPDILNFED